MNMGITKEEYFLDLIRMFISGNGVFEDSDSNELWFDVTDINGKDLRNVINKLNEELVNAGWIVKARIYGMGEGHLWFTEKGMRGIARIKENGGFWIEEGKLISYIDDGRKEPKLVIPEGVTSIGKHAFEDCYEIVHVVFPKTLENVEEDAFYFSDHLATEEAKLTFLEVSSEKTTFKGCPINLVHGCEANESIHFIINEALCENMEYEEIQENIVAVKFAEENEYPYFFSLEEAIVSFLENETSYEYTRIELADFWETAYYFNRAQAVAEYAISTGTAVEEVVQQFCRVAFNVHPRMKGENFSEKDAIAYMYQYQLLESYLKDKEIEAQSADIDDVEVAHGLVRTLLEYRRRYELNDQILLGLNSESVVEYLESLCYDCDFNIHCWDIFHDYGSSEYTQKEFLALGIEIAMAFGTHHAEGWVEIIRTMIRMMLKVCPDAKDYVIEWFHKSELMERYLENLNIGDEYEENNMAAVLMLIEYRKKYPLSESMILGLDPTGVEDFLDSVISEYEDLGGYHDMMNEEFHAHYELEEFISLGLEIAKVFVERRTDGWESIRESAMQFPNADELL